MVPHTKIQKLGGDYRVEHESTTVCSKMRIKVRQSFKVSLFLSSHLQNEVPGEQPIRPSGRTVVIHVLYVNTPQVPSAERDSHLHPGPPYRHQPRLAHLPAALRRHPAEQQAKGQKVAERVRLVTEASVGCWRLTLTDCGGWSWAWSVWRRA